MEESNDKFSELVRKIAEKKYGVIIKIHDGEGSDTFESLFGFSPSKMIFGCENEDSTFQHTSEPKVSLEAQLGQVTEECCELGQACMKLTRALGNGNPTRMSKDEAFEKVIEEFSDVIVAGNFLMELMQEEVPYDISEKIDAIADFKIKRKEKMLGHAEEA